MTKSIKRIARRSPVWRSVLVSGALLAAIGPGDVRAQDARVDPVLRAAMRPAARAALARLPDPSALVPGREPLPPGALAVQRDADGIVSIGLFVRISGEQGIESIRAAGGQVGSRIGDIVTARVPVDNVDALTGAPGIDYIEAARSMVAELDSSMIEIRANTIRTRAGDDWLGGSGEGSLVAIYDSGLDIEHDDFRDAQGNSRVLSVWDQTLNGRPPQGYDYGTVCDSAAIATRILTGAVGPCPMRDFTGHGTHVTGIAAGDGSATGGGLPAYRYPGVAPEAGIVFVKGGNNAFFEDLIIDGLAWLRSEAERLGRPMVVNLSLGGQFGPHDGSRLYELAIDELSGPGFVVVVAAGNHGDNRNTRPQVGGQLIHARGMAMPGTTQTFRLTLPQHTPHPDLCNGNVTQFGLWYDGADRLAIEVVRPSGSLASAPWGQTVTRVHAAGRIAIDNASAGPDPRNGDHGAHIRIDGCGGSGAPEPGEWQIRVTAGQSGTGRPYDMWIEVSSHGGFGAATAMLGGEGFDNRFVVASPANATRAIGVAAYATRMCWPSLSATGTSCYVEREEIGDLARFSAGGPRRDGVMKPEIAAPGIAIMSARSRTAGVPLVRAEPDNQHWAVEGTSMAAPHVTGALAVLMMVKPDLTPEEARQLLTSTATSDGFTSRIYDGAGLPSDWWGAGKLNVEAAMAALTGSGPAVLALSTDPATPDSITLAPRGTRLPLLAVRLGSQGTEAIDVTALTFRVSGDDPGAHLVLVRDANDNGSLDEQDVAIDSVAAPVTGAERTVTLSFEPGELRIPALGTTRVFAALSLSGAAPNGTVFQATFVPDQTQSVGVRTGEANELEVAETPLESGPAQTTVLRADELMTFSANPVRRDHVVFNFVEPPTTAAVYTLAGRRVIDLAPGAGLSLSWDLRNEDGSLVAPGVYLVVFRVREQLFREKLVVLTPAGSSP